MEVSYESLVHFLWIIPGFLLIAYLGSPRFSGTQGHTRVQRALKTGLEKSRYTILNDLSLPSGGGGTERFDHIVLSRQGIVVIDTQYRNGLIEGAEFQERWKCSRRWGASEFPNPLHRNWQRISALRELLELPEARFSSIVVFASESRFRKAVPKNVIGVDQLIPFIRRQAHHAFSPQETIEILAKIEGARLTPRLRFYLDPLRVVRGLLALLLIAGMYFVYKDELDEVYREVRTLATGAPARLQRAAADLRSEREKWEDSLICAYSVDTDRCACYEPKGEKVELETARCKALAQRGSVLSDE